MFDERCIQFWRINRRKTSPVHQLEIVGFSTEELDDMVNFICRVWALEAVHSICDTGQNFETFQSHFCKHGCSNYLDGLPTIPKYAVESIL